MTSELAEKVKCWSKTALPFDICWYIIIHNHKVQNIIPIEVGRQVVM